MKKYILLLVLVLNVGLGQAQDIPPGGCPCCEEHFGSDPDKHEPGSNYQDCLLNATDCSPEAISCTSVVPIDSNILILLALGISFGTYSLYQINKKRQFEK